MNARESEMEESVVKGLVETNYSRDLLLIPQINVG